MRQFIMNHWVMIYLMVYVVAMFIAYKSAGIFKETKDNHL